MRASLQESLEVLPSVALAWLDKGDCAIQAKTLVRQILQDCQEQILQRSQLISAALIPLDIHSHPEPEEQRDRRLYMESLQNSARSILCCKSCVCSGHEKLLLSAVTFSC